MAEDRYGNYGYEYAHSPASGAMPGTQMLGAFYKANFEGISNVGIYANRDVRGEPGTLSLHAEGRALDIMVPVGSKVGDQIATWSAIHARGLGIQEVIWNRKIWSVSQSAAGFRPYKGVNPHTDHVHVGIIKAAASGSNQLNREYLQGFGSTDFTGFGILADGASKVNDFIDDNNPLAVFQPIVDAIQWVFSKDGSTRIGYVVLGFVVLTAGLLMLVPNLIRPVEAAIA